MAHEPARDKPQETVPLARRLAGNALFGGAMTLALFWYRGTGTAYEFIGFWLTVAIGYTVFESVLEWVVSRWRRNDPGATGHRPLRWR